MCKLTHLLRRYPLSGLVSGGGIRDIARVITRAILVVDDEDAVRDVLTWALKEMSYTVTAAANGHAAIRAMSHEKFDAIITDLWMPDGDGFEVIAFAKRVQPDACLVAISGASEQLDDDFRRKVTRYLSGHVLLAKPFRLAQLFAAIEPVDALPVSLAAVNAAPAYVGRGSCNGRSPNSAACTEHPHSVEYDLWHAQGSVKLVG